MKNNSIAENVPNVIELMEYAKHEHAEVVRFW